MLTSKIGNPDTIGSWTLMLLIGSPDKSYKGV